jgi:hypothetical protein
MSTAPVVNKGAYLVKVESCPSNTALAPPPQVSLHIFSLTTITLLCTPSPFFLSAPRQRRKNATRSASFIWPRHHWHQMTSNPDSSSSSTEGAYPTRPRRVEVYVGRDGLKACRVPCRTVTLREESWSPFHRKCSGGASGLITVLARARRRASWTKLSTGSRRTTSERR